MKPGRRSTNLEFALLGLISQGRKSAYDTQVIFTETPMARYSASPGAIYPAIKRLVVCGYLQEHEQRGAKGRPKTIYSLSAKGKKALKAWLKILPDYHQVSREDDICMLRFSFMVGILSDEEILEFLISYSAACSEFLKDLKKLQAQFEQHGSDHAALTLQAGIMGIMSQIKWAQKAIGIVEHRGDGGFV